MLEDILEESWTYKEIIQKGMQKGLEKGLEKGLDLGLQQGLEKVVRKNASRGFKSSARHSSI